MIDLKNKKVLITGATGGIGGSLVKKFLSLNAEVLGTGTKSDKLEKLKNEFNKIKLKKGPYGYYLQTLNKNKRKNIPIGKKIDENKINIEDIKKYL